MGWWVNNCGDMRFEFKSLSPCKARMAVHISHLSAPMERWRWRIHQKLVVQRTCCTYCLNVKIETLSQTRCKLRMDTQDWHLQLIKHTTHALFPTMYFTLNDASLLMLVIPALRRLKWEDCCEFKASLACIVSSNAAQATQWDPDLKGGGRGETVLFIYFFCNIKSKTSASLLLPLKLPLFNCTCL